MSFLAPAIVFLHLHVAFLGLWLALRGPLFALLSTPLVRLLLVRFRPVGPWELAAALATAFGRWRRSLMAGRFLLSAGLACVPGAVEVLCGLGLSGLRALCLPLVAVCRLFLWVRSGFVWTDFRFAVDSWLRPPPVSPPGLLTRVTAVVLALPGVLVDDVKLQWRRGFVVWAPSVTKHARDVRSVKVLDVALRREFRLLPFVVSVSLLAVVLGLCLLRSHVKQLRVLGAQALGIFEDTPLSPPEGTGSAKDDPDGIATVMNPIWSGGRCLENAPVTWALSGRLRPRARWVRALEATLGGRRGAVASFLRGRWVPDLPTKKDTALLQYSLGSLENGARFLGGGTINGEASLDSEGNEVCNSVVYLILDHGDTVSLFVPALVAKLRMYALFRERDSALLGALRTRAVEWCKAKGLSTVLGDLAVSGSVPCAFEPSTHERSANAHVQSVLSDHQLPSHGLL